MLRSWMPSVVLIQSNTVLTLIKIFEMKIQAQIEVKKDDN